MTYSIQGMPMTCDPDQQYFSDGITEDIITALSRSPLKPEGC